MVDFQRDWCSLTTATVLAGQFAAEWCIYIWIWCKIWTFGLNHPNLSLAFDAVITGRDDVVQYCGVWGSRRRTSVSSSLVIEVIDFYCSARLWWLWSSMEVIVDTNFLRLVCIAYFFIWHFCTTWFAGAGDFNNISRTNFTLFRHCDGPIGLCTGPPTALRFLFIFSPRWRICNCIN